MRPVMNLIASLEVKKSGVYSAAHAPSELHNSRSARAGANDFAPARAFLRAEGKTVERGSKFSCKLRKK
jgi:hypothetical protein